MKLPDDKKGTTAKPVSETETPNEDQEPTSEARGWKIPPGTDLSADDGH